MYFLIRVSLTFFLIRVSHPLTFCALKILLFHIIVWVFSFPWSLIKIDCNFMWSGYVRRTWMLKQTHRARLHHHHWSQTACNEKQKQHFQEIKSIHKVRQRYIFSWHDDSTHSLHLCFVTVVSIIFKNAYTDVDAKCKWEPFSPVVHDFSVFLCK